MSKVICAQCRQLIDVDETGRERLLTLVTHTRAKPCEEDEGDENTHLRNVRDEICPGSGVCA